MLAKDIYNYKPGLFLRKLEIRGYYKWYKEV